MKFQEIKKGIYWVGAIDWDIRNFHGYQTEQGTSYNAYLIIDDKVTLIDTVKENLAEKMLFRISGIIDIRKIDYVISNHSEMDHSGSIPRIMELAPNAKIYATKQGQSNLLRHFKADWDIQVVKTGDTLSLGERSLSFTSTPLLHWPDSMVSYCPEEKLLFSNDAFGQHIASAERYEDELGWDIVRRAAAKYYANIIIPFGKQTSKALNVLSDMPIDIICPSHGVMIRNNIDNLLVDYEKWSKHITDPKALIVYDSMWGSTDQLSFMLQNGLEDENIRVTKRNLKVNHISDIMTDVLESKLILLGSPTLNGSMLPTMGSFLTYLKGLKPQNRIGYAFGSYGWKGEATAEIHSVMESMKWELPAEPIDIKYRADQDEMNKVFEIGKKLGQYLLAKS